MQLWKLVSCWPCRGLPVASALPGHLEAHRRTSRIVSAAASPSPRPPRACCRGWPRRVIEHGGRALSPHLSLSSRSGWSRGAPPQPCTAVRGRQGGRKRKGDERAAGGSWVKGGTVSPWSGLGAIAHLPGAAVSPAGVPHAAVSRAAIHSAGHFLRSCASANLQ